jgi:hypothetical protein
MPLAGTTLVTRTTDRRLVYPWYAAVLTRQALFNPVFHAGTTVAFREYSPGVATSPLFLAVWALATRAALRERLASRRGVAVSIAAGAAIQGWAVADQVFFAFDGRGSDEAGQTGPQCPPRASAPRLEPASRRPRRESVGFAG